MFRPGEGADSALAALDLLNGGGLVLFQIGALVPDTGESVVAAFANGPDDDGDGLGGAFEVDGRIVEARARGTERNGRNVASVSARMRMASPKGPRPRSGKSA